MEAPTDDIAVVFRCLDYIRAGKSNDAIWRIIKTEFGLPNSGAAEEEAKMRAYSTMNRIRADIHPEPYHPTPIPYKRVGRTWVPAPVPTYCDK